MGVIPEPTTYDEAMELADCNDYAFICCLTPEQFTAVLRLGKIIPESKRALFYRKACKTCPSGKP